MDRVRIYRQNSKCDQTVWEFWFDISRCILWLDSYWNQTRETPRHKWKPNSGYDRLNSRYSTMPLEIVPLPEDVQREAIARFSERIHVEKWNKK